MRCQCGPEHSGSVSDVDGQYVVWTKCFPHGPRENLRLRPAVNGRRLFPLSFLLLGVRRDAKSTLTSALNLSQ